MTTTPERESPSPEAFREGFAAVSPLIREEWPALSETDLAETEGDLDKVTSLVAAHCDRTRVGVRRHLSELLALAERSRERVGAESPASPPRSSGRLDIEDVLRVVRRLESIASDEARRASARVLPVAEKRVRENPWTSLLVALGLGFLLGLWVTGGRRRP